MMVVLHLIKIHLKKQQQIFSLGIMWDLNKHILQEKIVSTFQSFCNLSV